MNIPLERGQEGESKFGFTVGERVEVVSDSFFHGRFGRVKLFGDLLVVVDLEESQKDTKRKGELFLANELLSAPK